jgi:hypothetical protein
MLYMQFTVLIFLLKSLAHIYFQQSLFTIHITCFSFGVLQFPSSVSYSLFTLSHSLQHSKLVPHPSFHCWVDESCCQFHQIHIFYIL